MGDENRQAAASWETGVRHQMVPNYRVQAGMAGHSWIAAGHRFEAADRRGNRGPSGIILAAEASECSAPPAREKSVNHLTGSGV